MGAKNYLHWKTPVEANKTTYHANNNLQTRMELSNVAKGKKST